MTMTLVVKSNPSSPGVEILVSDVGWTVPGAGGQSAFEDKENIAEILASEDIRTLSTDDAYNPNGSTLILNDGVNDIPPAGVDDFLDGLEQGRRNNCAATAPPTINDDETIGYAPCSRWVITSGPNKGRAWVNYDATGGAALWAEITGGTTISGNEVAFEIDFTFADVSPLLIGVLSPGDKIIHSELQIKTPFDDPLAQLELGDIATPGRFIGATENLPGRFGTYTNGQNFDIPAADAVRLTITPGASTQGTGQVIVTVRRA